MRKIEYRGWNDDEYKWFYGDMLQDFSESSRYIAQMSNGDIEYTIVDKDTIGQYTGLKDRNGQEIYEDDVVKVRTTLYKVIYENGAFYLYHLQLKDYDGKNLQWGLLNRIYDRDMTDFFAEMEVIGNIYENKDLLKEKK